jgi:hypothetical protein
MKNIRNSVFETNSSSTHSISLSVDFECLTDTIDVPDNGVIEMYGGEYGWGVEIHTDAWTKINYLLTYMKDTNTSEDTYNKVIDIIKEHTGAKEILFELGDGYIDHQSHGKLGKFFEHEEHIKNFLFNPKSELIISNDNI